MNTHYALGIKHRYPVTTLLVCLLLTACVGSSAKVTQAPATPQASKTLELPPTPSVTQSNPITPTGENTGTLKPTIQPSPTAKLFASGIDCGTIDENGTVLFLNQSMAGDRHRPSMYDLFAMNGNGCFPRLILEQASGSPAWSRDWKRIAIGCEDNTAICILDAKTTLDTCTVAGPHEESRCHPDILQKITLPAEISGEHPVNNISWSPDGTQIAVDGEKSVHILTLTDAGEWKTLIDNSQGIDTDWSPKENRLVISGLSLIDLNGNREVKLVDGMEPQWSPDATQIAFLKASTDENKMYWGIAVVDPVNGKWEWLYKLTHLNMQDWPRQNLFIHDSANHRLLSWSPDRRYIAFAAIYQHDYDNQIFRLDIETGKIVALTLDLLLAEGDPYFFAPAWGP